MNLSFPSLRRALTAQPSLRWFTVFQHGLHPFKRRERRAELRQFVASELAAGVRSEPALFQRSITAGLYSPTTARSDAQGLQREFRAQLAQIESGQLALRPDTTPEAA